MLRSMPISLPGGGSDSLFFLLIALAVNALFGGLSLPVLRPWHPEVLFGRLTDGFDRRLNREKRSARNRTIRGALVVLMLAALAFGVGMVLLDFASDAPFGRYGEIFLLALLIPLRPVFDEGRALAKALKAGRVSLAAFPFLAGGPKGDPHLYARLGIERVSVRFGMDVLAPVFWFVLLGLPGVMLSRAARVLCTHLGGTDPRHQAFGFAARQFDAALGLLPVRLAGIFFVGAAIFTPTANPIRSFRVLINAAGRHPDGNAGWPVAATAGALDVALLGPGHGEPGEGGEETVQAHGVPWIGTGRARLGFQDLHRALYLFAVAAFLLFGATAALYAV